jgi:hypothetical protein
MTDNAMTSILIVAEHKQEREEYAYSYCRKKEIDTHDITIVDIKKENADTKKTAASIGIERIKQLQQTLYLKPIRSHIKACIIHDAQLLTPEAQNAMLKLLEEPPQHTILILTSDSREALLPTVLSRCLLITLHTGHRFSSEKRNELLDSVLKLATLSTGEKLKLAELLSKNKEEAKQWISDMTIIMHEEMHNAGTDGDMEKVHYFSMLLRSFRNTYQTIDSTNINVRMTLEILLLNTERLHK